MPKDSTGSEPPVAPGQPARYSERRDSTLRLPSGLRLQVGFARIPAGNEA